MVAIARPKRERSLRPRQTLEKFNELLTFSGALAELGFFLRLHVIVAKFACSYTLSSSAWAAC
jgi:hypothetical protein